MISINEIFTSTGIIIRNKYIDIFRRAYFINKIQDCGIKNIEVSNNFGLINSQKHITFTIYTNDTLNKTLNNMYTDECIDLFNKNKKDMSSKLLILGPTNNDFEYIIRNTKPDFIEVQSINKIIMNTVDNPNNIFVRPPNDATRFKVIDEALSNNIVNFSGSLLSTSDTIETIDLVQHIRSRLGYSLQPINLTMLKEVKKEIEDDFNW